MSPTSPPTQSPDLSPTLSPRPAALGLLVAASLLGALALAPRASAADLDGGYTDVPSLPQQVVTFGSGWYVRGDIAVTEGYKVNIEAPSTIVKTGDAVVNPSLGGGYAFTNNVRIDIVGDYYQPSHTCVGYNASECNDIGSLHRYDALVNGYYDFGTWSIVTPYLGAGAGVAFGDKTRDLGTINFTNFAFALMAGIALDVYPHVKLDINYRFVDAGTVFGAKLYDHEIRAGLRYMIDN